MTLIVPGRNTRRTLALALAAACLWASFSTPAGEPVPAFLVGPYLQDPGQNHMTIMWISASNAECSVRYGQGGALTEEIKVKPGEAIKDAWPEQKRTEYIYQAKVAGLKPGTGYSYSVTCSGTEAKGTFKTLPENPDKLTFIVYGDSRSQPEVHAKVAACFLKHDPAFILHSGDMIDKGAYEAWKPYFFDPLAKVIDRVPILTARGNHEGDGKSYLQVLSLPNNKLWYSFDCGSAHIVVLDSNGWRHDEEKANVEAMRKWCEQDLAASKARWKIVCYHEPTYDLSDLNDKWGKEGFLPIFRKNGVDLVFSGHVHGYQRFHPMVKKGENVTHPITYVISAGGGAPLHKEKLEAIPHLAATAVEYHYMVIDIQGLKLSAQALTPEGRSLDSFVIAKKDDGFDEAYLETALYEDEFGKTAGVARPFGDLKQLKTTLAQAQTAERGGNLGPALAAYEKALAITRATGFDAETDKALLHGDELIKAAGKEVDAALALFAEKRYEGCLTELEKLAVKYRGHEAGTRAQAKLTEFGQSKDVAAARKLAEARKLLEAKEYLKAREALQAVAAMEGVAEAQTAKEELEKLAKNPDFLAKITEASAEKECRAWLNMAENCLKNNMKDMATQYLDKIITKYPQTKWAEEARRLKGE